MKEQGELGNFPGPETIHLDIINACDAACVSCWDHSPCRHSPVDPSWRSRQADPVMLLRAIDEARELGGLKKVIVSGGGEPALHPGLNGLLGALKARDLHVSLITNLVHARCEDWDDKRVDALLVGIHAADEAGYLNFHRGFRSGHWQMLLTHLSRLPARGIEVKHVQVICTLNVRQMPEMIELGARYAAARVGFKLASLQGGTEQFALTAADRHWLEDQGLARTRKLAKSLGVRSNLDHFQAQLAAGDGATADAAGTGCHLGRLYARIGVEGEVLYCCNPQIPVGRLADGCGFAALWRGERWEALRRRLARREFFPGCERCGKYEQNRRLALKPGSGTGRGAGLP